MDKPLIRIAFTTPYFYEGEAEAIARLLATDAVDYVHIRKPGSDSAAVGELIAKIPDGLRRRITLHDHAELAQAVGGIHLNSRMTQIPEGWKGRLSVSLHSIEEVERETRNVDYVTLSPVFDSISKRGYASAFALPQLEMARAEGVIDDKVIALGGVTADRLPAVRRMGFGGAALLGAIWSAADPDTAARRLKTMVETLVRALLDTGADCSFCGLVHDYPDHSRNFPEQPVYRLTDGEGAIREILMNYIAIAGPVCKLFRRDLLETGDGTGIFPEDLTIGEDAVAVTEALCRAEITVFDTKPLYHYNHREQSLMSSSYSERDWDLIKAYKRIYERLAGHDLAKEAMFRQIWAHFHVYDKMILSGQYDAGGEQEILSWLRHHYKEIMKNPYVGKMRKVSMCMLKINKYLYQRIIRLNHR